MLLVEWTKCKIRELQIPVKTITYYLLRKLLREVKSHCLCCISSPFFEESFEKSLSSPFSSHFDVAGVSFSKCDKLPQDEKVSRTLLGVEEEEQGCQID